MAAAILIGDAPASAMALSFSLSSADQGRISGIITHTPPTERRLFPVALVGCNRLVRQQQRTDDSLPDLVRDMLSNKFKRFLQVAQAANPRQVIQRDLYRLLVQGFR
jgi:hypothetical protein